LPGCSQQPASSLHWRHAVRLAERPVDNRILLSVYYAFRGLSLFYLPFAFDFSVYGLPLFSAVYGLDWIASAPPTVRLLTGVVGTEKSGIMVAWITVIHQIGSAAAAYLGGLLRISFGTYLEAFMLAGALLMVAALMGHCQLGGACRSVAAFAA